VTSTTDIGATSDTAARDAERYLKDVAPHLAALPAEERADLLDDLAQHLREIAAEEGPPLVERLGPPEAYAAELLASAGVVTGGGASRPLSERAGDVVDRARASWIGGEVVRLAPVLRPAWWVIRAYLAVSLLGATGGNGSTGFPVPHLAGNPALGLLGVIVAIPLSVRLGQRSVPRSGRLLVAGGNAVLAIYALSLLGGSGTPIRYVESDVGPSAYAAQGCLATASGQPITNLYAYDADGRLLDPVLLYDQDGQPVDNLCPERDTQGRRLATEYRQDVNGAPVVNAFPRRQTAVVPSPRPPFGSKQPEPTVPVKPPVVVVPRLTPTSPPTPTTTLPAPAG
jgi:hypothetical protein